MYVVEAPQAVKSETPKSQSCVPKYAESKWNLEKKYLKNILFILEIIDKSCPLFFLEWGVLGKS